MKKMNKRGFEDVYLREKKKEEQERKRLKRAEEKENKKKREEVSVEDIIRKKNVDDEKVSGIISLQMQEMALEIRRKYRERKKERGVKRKATL